MLDPSEFINESIKEIKNTIGNKKAIIALSGGVDSSVASVLTSTAIGICRSWSLKRRRI